MSYIPYKRNWMYTFQLKSDAKPDSNPTNLTNESNPLHRPCSLGELCTCAVGVRVDDVITILDVCTKGHLQAWSWTQSGRVPDEEDRGAIQYSPENCLEYCPQKCPKNPFKKCS